MEWTVVLVIAEVVALLAAVTAPILKLNSSITTLTTVMKHQQEKIDDLEDDLEDVRTKATDSHRRIWAASEDHDKRLNDHEMRITFLEKNDKT